MIHAIVREALASARSQPVASTVTILMVMGMVLTVMLTTGRTVGSEQQVLGTIDSVGTRSITIRAEPGAGVTSNVLDRIGDIEGIEWAGAFSAATDGVNAHIPDGTKVPVRQLYSTQTEDLGIPQHSAVPGGLAWVSGTALAELGMLDVAGGVTLTNGESFGVAGQIDVPDFLRGFEPIVFVPQPRATGLEHIGLIIVIAESPELVAPVSAAVISVLAPDDATKISVQTSEALADLRAIIEGQLGSFSRGLVIALVAVTGMLVAMLLYGLVMMRRKDFGRRRALGASRRLIIALILVQTGLLAGMGIAIGTVVSWIALITGSDPWPGAAFTVALGILTLVMSLIAALVPAAIASRREPIRELRVP